MPGAQWQLTNFINVALTLVADTDLLKPACKAMKTVEKHREAILARWGGGIRPQQRQDLSSQWHLPSG